MINEQLAAMKQALETCEAFLLSAGFESSDAYAEVCFALKQAETAQGQEPVTILPDGSAFGVMSFPLPSDHWLYAPNEYRDGEYEPIDLPKPILTHALRDAVVAAVRYAVRGATMRGQEMDFDPDALVQNAVYALCGPYTTPPAAALKPLTNEQIWNNDKIMAANSAYGATFDTLRELTRAIEKAHGITGETK